MSVPVSSKEFLADPEGDWFSVGRFFLGSLLYVFRTHSHYITIQIGMSRTGARASGDED